MGIAARRYGFVFLCLAILIVLLYGNSLQNSWHFDDYKNIVDNPNVHLDQLTWKGIKHSWQGISGETVPRPLSFFTFALNYYLGELDVLGYHIVNIAIHYLVAVVLFFLFLDILALPLARQNGEAAYAIALLSTVLWAIHPVQVTGVTYIIQRMTSLCALFYIAAMLFYLKARMAKTVGQASLYGSICLVAAVLSLASKENGAMLPVSLFFLDLLLIQGVTRESLKKNLLIILIPLSILLIVGAYFTSLTAILDGYRHRPFTLAERFWTEFRVVLFYISLLLYPAIDRLTLLYDITVSTSLFRPPSTLVAFSGIVGMVALAFALARRKPLLSYCIIFFLLNHLIEGSIVPLELIFEHRNYLPSMFFFMPPAMGVLYLYERFARRAFLRDGLLIVSSLILILLGTGVITRNGVFRDELSLWSDNAAKSPHLHRPHHNLGIVHLSAGRLAEGRDELLRALAARDNSGRYNKSHTWFYLGQYQRMVGADNDAVQSFKQALHIMPSHPDVHQAMAEVLLKQNDLAAAERHIGQALARKPRDGSYHLTYAEILLRKGWPDAAIAEAKRAIQDRGDAAKAYSLMAKSYELKHDSKSAVLYRSMAEREMKKPDRCRK